MTAVDKLCPPGIGLSSDAESSWDAIAGGQAAEVRCLCADPIDIVAVCMAKPEDLHDTLASFPAVASIEPRGIDYQLSGARAMPTEPGALKRRSWGEIRQKSDCGSGQWLCRIVQQKEERPPEKSLKG
jgi:hypothetical protein